MKKLSVTLALLLCFVVAKAQNVGIAVNTPTEKLHVDSGSIKIGKDILSAGQSNLLKFGDGSFCTIGESDFDDQMSFNASYYIFKNNGGFGGGRVGINVLTGVPDAQLHVNGNVKIADGTEGLGKVFVSDAAGVGSWSTSFSFGAHMNGSIAMPGGSTLSNAFTISEYNPAGGYSPATCVYIAPTSGIYHFDASAITQAGTNGHTVRLRLRKNLTGIREATVTIPAVGTTSNISLSADVQLTVGDQVDLLIVNSSLSTLNIFGDAGTTVPGTYFNGHLVR